MTPALFAIVAGAALLASVIANVRPRPVIIGLPTTIIGFFTAELARVHLVFQVLATIVWIALGALAEPVGLVGVVMAAASVALLEIAHRRGVAARDVIRAALPAALEATSPTPLIGVSRPDFEGIEIRRDLEYGPHKRNRADLYLPAERRGAPIVLQVHGGGWVIGNNRQQGQPLLAHFAQAGWIGVAINYRLGPTHRLPAAIHDTKQAIAWVRANAGEWGGDPDRILLTGGSAGGHLTALCALTADDASLQPGFEEADCSVAAAAPMYGVFDLTDRNRRRGRSAMTPFLHALVMGTKLGDDAEGWDALSPIARVRPDAPPMLIVNGTYDTLVPIEEARDFADAMSAVSPAATFVELPHAHHAFDVINSPRTRAVIEALEGWAGAAMGNRV
ncbi:MAG: alpha/beta hydrolase [Acidimicrobiales bacterium]